MASLLSYLGKRIQGAVAEANPWDNGATYNSVVHGAPRQAPRPQPRPQVQGPIPVGPAQARNVSVAQAPQQRVSVVQPQRPQPSLRVVGPRPTLRPQGFNSSEVRLDPAQRMKLDRELNRGSSFEDASDRLGLGVEEIRSYTTATRPSYGIRPFTPASALKGAGDFVRNMGDAVADIVQKPVITLAPTKDRENAYQALRGAYSRGDITQGKFNEEATKLSKDVIGKRTVINDKGFAENKNQNPLEFAQAFTDAGYNAASVIPAVKGANLAMMPVKVALKPILREGATWGTIDTLNDAVQGRLSPEQTLMNYGLNMAIPGTTYGAAHGVKVGAPVVVKGAQKGAQVAKEANTAIERTNPRVKEIDEFEMPRLQQAFDVETNPVRRVQINRGIAQLNQERRSLTQGGYVKIPGGQGSQEIKNLEDFLNNPSVRGGVRRKAEEQLSELRANAALSDSQPTAVIEQPISVAQPVSLKQSAKKLPRQIQTVAGKENRNSGLVPDSQAQTNHAYADDYTPVMDESQVNDYVKAQTKIQDKARKDASGGFVDKVSETKADFKEKFIDDLSPIEDRLNKAIKEGASVDPKNHITYQLDRSRRAEGVMNAYIKDNGLDRVIQNVPDTKEFDQYLIARHAKELGEDIKTGRNPEKDAALVRALDGRYGEVAKEVYRYNQKLLDTAVDYGLISKTTARNLKKQYPEYVPFNRIFNEDELTKLHGNGSGDASISSQSAVKKIKGSNRAIESPLESIIDKTRVVVEQGERNRAAQMLASYKDLPGNPFGLKEIPANETIGTRHTISYLDNGKKRTFEVDPEIEEAAKHLTREQIGLWGRIAAIPARVLRAGATTVNAGFAGANIVKDVVGATINSKHSMRVADPRSVGKALAAALHHNGKEYQELMREGVSGTSFDMYRNPGKSNVAEIRSQKNLGTRAAYNLRPDRWFRTAENTIGRSEDFGRALQYYSNKSGFEAELGKGSVEAKLLAADQARNNSTNFFRHGSVGKNVNLAIPYWNAGVQGARIQTRRIAQDPIGTLTKISAVIVMPSAIIAGSNYATPERREIMDNISDYEKENNIIVLGDNPKFNEETGRWDDVYKFPVPPQHNGIHTAVQSMVASMVDGRRFDGVKHAGNIAQNYTTINPVDARDTANTYTPQGIKLVAEPMTNTNFYTGNKIVPDSQKNLPAKDQFGDYTSGTAKLVGGALNISPRNIDNSFRTGLGGAGQNLLNISDTALSKVGAIDKKDVRGKSVADSIAHRFVGATAIPASEKAEKEFKKLKEQILSSSEYKNASQYDKGRMLNRLQTDLDAVAWNKSGKSDNKLTSKQEALRDGGFDKSVYTNLDAKTKKDDSKDTGWTDEYNALKETFDKESKTWTPVKRATKEKELRTLDVKRKYSKDVTSLYGMSKGDVYDFVSKDPNGKKYVDQVVAYGDAMVNAGLIAYNKFRDKNGNISLNAPGTKVAKAGGKRSSGGRKASGGRKTTSGRKKASGATTGSSLLALQTSLNGKLRVPKTTGGKAPSFNAQTPQKLKKTSLKKYAVKGAKLEAKAPKLRAKKA